MAKPRSSAPIATSATLGPDGGRDRTTLAAVGAALASLLQGYHTGVIGGALLYLAPEFGLATDPKLTGAIVTATTVGSVVGTAAAARLSDGIGRRSTLAIASWASLAGSALLCVSRTAGGLVAARGLVGVAVGMAGAVVPVYIAETAQASRRGALAAIPQTFVSLGIFSAYLVSLLIAAVFPAAGWRPMMAASLVPAAVHAAMVLWVLPESPRWLLQRRRPADALRALSRLRGADTAAALAAAEEELRAMGPVGAAEKAKGGEGGGFGALLEPRLLRLLCVVVALQALQQLSGINAVVYYTPTVLKEAGVPRLFASVGLDENAASLAATALAYALRLPAMLATISLMDRLGRRSLLLRFIPLMALSHLALAASLLHMASASSALPAAAAVVALCGYGVAFSLSLGPIPNILTSELFPMRARAAAMSVSLAAQFVCNTAVGAGFPALRASLGSGGVFFAFAAVCAAGWLVTAVAVPETKGRALEDDGGEGKTKAS